MLDRSLRRLFAAARAEGRSHLTEPEALEVARALGLAVPLHLVVAGAAEAEAADLSVFPGELLVVKAVSSEILHKSDAGAVAVVEKTPAAAPRAVEAMARRLEEPMQKAPGAGGRPDGWPRTERSPTRRARAARSSTARRPPVRAPLRFGLFEHVAHDASFGGELLLGLRWSEEFGPVVTLGPGGTAAEHLAAHLRPGGEAAVFSPGLTPRETWPEILARQAVTAPLTGLRGRPPRLAAEDLLALLAPLLDFAAEACPGEVVELEINPLVLVPGRGPLALDALLRLGAPGRDAGPALAPTPPLPPAPAEKIARLLAPRSLAVVGVSRRHNPGRILLENALAQGFPRESVTVVKPGVEEIAGCRAVPDLASLPGKVDLLVLAVEAAQVPALLEQAVVCDLAEGVILIPGGLGETAGSEGRVERLRAALAAARRRGRGPAVLGGNCLGLRSLPGRLDTLFIPRPKLPFPGGEPQPVAILSQSGAFAIARASKLPWLDPLYLVTYGNQLDLTAGDLLAHLAEDPQVEVFACYVEGFRPGDGRRFLEAARRISASGRRVILYRAGRTAAGARAAASHTASVAGDWVVTRELARSAGVLVAETMADFEDLLRLCVLLRGRRLEGAAAGAPRLGAVSNAGFECVATADSLGPFRLASFAETTARRLEEVLERARLEAVVEVRNPLDVTPILGDEGFAEAARVVLEDPSVDLGLVGCVPLTGALSTLAAGDGHGEDAEAEGAVGRRLAELWRRTSKPWVAVVDAGPLYDPLARLLEGEGVPVLRTADRALRLLALWAGGD